VLLTQQEKGLWSWHLGVGKALMSANGTQAMLTSPCVSIWGRWMRPEAGIAPVCVSRAHVERLLVASIICDL
jgi:hypothetical protein